MSGLTIFHGSCGKIRTLYTYHRRRIETYECIFQVKKKRVEKELLNSKEKTKRVELLNSKEGNTSITVHLILELSHTPHLQCSYKSEMDDLIHI